MLRCRLSTVRTVGGHDTGPRLSQTLRFSILRFSCTQVGPIADLVGEPDTPKFTLSYAQHNSPGSQDPLHLFLESSANIVEHRDRCTGSSPQTSHYAIDALRWYLSLDNVTSDRPFLCSATTLRSLYYRAESRNQLGMLDSDMLTFLISLFGSLSVDPCLSLPYRVPLAARLLQVSTRRTHWRFILKVGKYKSERGMSLHDSDRFWLMRAELAAVQASSTPESLSGDAHSAILRARIHYHIIRRHSRHPEVHAYYLETLLAIRDPRLPDLAAHDLSFLLRTHTMCRPWLQRLLYRLVIHYGGLLSTRSQEAILAALWGRRKANKTFDLIPENGLAGTGLGLNDCNLDAISIARSISATLLGFAGHPPNDRLVDMSGHLVSALFPEHALPLRWGSLLLFSVFNSSKTSHFSGMHWTSDQTMPQVTSCWQVIFGLATVEKMIQEPTPPLEMQGTSARELSRTTRALYQRWSSILNPCLVPRDLACAVSTSFYKIASFLADATLLVDCQGLHHIEDHLQCSQKSVSKRFVAHYIAAIVRVRGLFPDVVFTALEAFSPDPKQQCQFLASAVEILAPIDAHLAYKLYTVAQEKGMKPDTVATHKLATSLAQRGALRQAVLLIDHERFSPEERGILLSVIARSLRENPWIRYPLSVFVAIADELVALYRLHVPPEHFRGHLEQLFVVLSRHGRGSQLLPAALSILRKLPGFFKPRFFDRYCRALIRHRQLSAANQFLDAIITAQPRIAHSLRILKDRIAAQTRASRLLKPPRRRPMSLKLSSRLRRCLHAGAPLERSLRELLKSGRVLAAKQVFAGAALTVPSSRRTALGNILLHGVSLQPTPRNGRRVRRVLALLENLVQRHGLRPDRVTVNILIKVMISWRSAFGSSRLRGLFDRLVRGGYPAGAYSALHPPFGTRQTPLSGSSSLSTLPSFVSFEKHSKPLYKMLIKAFYSCNDVEAARMVVGILRVEEYKSAMEKERRQRARSKGRVKAAQKNMTC